MDDEVVAFLGVLVQAVPEVRVQGACVDDVAEGFEELGWGPLAAPQQLAELERLGLVQVTGDDLVSVTRMGLGALEGG